MCRSGSCSITPPAWAIRGTGSGSRVRRRLFQAFQAHYGFDCSLGNPYSGREKGAVESKVGMVRRKLFGPGRAYGAWRTTTPGCRTGAWSWPRNRTAARTRRSAACSPRTVRRCCRCPGSVSTSAAWRHMKADRYGVAAPGGRHRCSADRANAGREPVVGLRALVTRGPRLVGQAPGDPSSGVRPGRHEQRGPVHAVGAAVQQARVLAQQPGA